MSGAGVDFLRALEALDWFVGLPAGLVERQRDGVRKLSDMPWEGLATTHVDCEYLLHDRPYAALVEMFARGSAGVFRPERIREEAQDGGARLSFGVGDRAYALSLPLEADEPPPLFFDTLNRALAESGSSLRFARLLDLKHSPIPAYVLGAPPALARLAASGLAPLTLPPDVPPVEGVPRWRALAWSASHGTQRIQLVVGRQPVGSMDVPGGYRNLHHIEIKGSQDVLVEYAGEGAASIRCGRPLAIADYVKAHAKWAGVDRQIQPTVTTKTTQPEPGCARHEGELRWKRPGGELRFSWRCDERENGAVQLFYCAPVDVSAAFAAGLDTFRLAERTPGLDKLLEAGSRQRRK